ncbi:MAG: PAS domain S-box protein, partial [Epsilonproteobacteria bacterium]|nr:PAS domain S-box protein [Campylobacterota bacterium]
DAKRVENDTYYSKLLELYKEEFKYTAFDIIISVDNEALEFLTKYRDKIFQNTPIVFCGINNFTEDMIDYPNFRYKVTGVVESVDIRKNIELITKMVPYLNKILIISDKSKSGLEIKKEIFKIMKDYFYLNYEYLDMFDLKSIKKIVKSLKKHDAILYVFHQKDSSGKYFTYKNSLKEVSSVSKVPIFGLWDFDMGYGVVGGALLNGYSQGEEAAKITKKILFDSVEPKDIPIVKNSTIRYTFDYNLLQKYRLKIPPFIKDKAIILNKPESFYQKYKKLVWIVSLIFIFLSVMSIILIINIARKNRAEKRLQEQIKFLEVLIETIPAPIFYKDKDGKYLGCNKAFCDFIGVGKDKIIGKTSFSFFNYFSASENTKRDQELLNSLKNDIYETTLYSKNGKFKKQVIISKAPFYLSDNSVGGIVCVIDDITEVTQQKQFINQQAKLAEMGDMIAAIAHQWNEPLVELSAIVQDLQMRFMENDLNSEDIKEFVKDSMTQIQYMSKTLKDFREFLKPKNSKTKFSLKKAFDEIYEIVGKQIFYSHINLMFNINSSDNDFLIYGYENDFKQVLLNIINNAKNKIIELKNNGNKYSIYVEAYEDEDNIFVDIKDNAGKIDEDIIESIFDPYFTTKKDGTGLGLYVAKIIIEDKMGGKLSVKNEGEDTVVFTIKLAKEKSENTVT